MKRCHYIRDHDGTRVLIPGCWSVVISNDKRDCSCPAERATPKFLRKKRESMRRQIEELKQRIEICEALLKVKEPRP